MRIFIPACAAFLMFSSIAHVQEAIPYPTVAAALKALQAKPGVVFSKEDNWTFAKDTDGVNWSFTPAGHYAHPAVGRREIKVEQGRFFVETRIKCEASKANCDKLHKDYQLLDQRMNEAIQRPAKEEIIRAADGYAFSRK